MNEISDLYLTSCVLTVTVLALRPGRTFRCLEEPRYRARGQGLELFMIKLNEVEDLAAQDVDR